MSDARPVLLMSSMTGWGSGRGSEKSREVCRSRAVGEVAALDIASSREDRWPVDGERQEIVI